MNCKPMEIACVTRAQPANSDLEVAVLKHLMGIPVRVTSISYDNVWTIEEPIHVKVWLGPTTMWIGRVSGIDDAYLTPFRGDPIEHLVTDEVNA